MWGEVLTQRCKFGERSLEEAVDVAHFNNHSLQLGVVLDRHLAVLSAKPWQSTVEIM